MPSMYESTPVGIWPTEAANSTHYQCTKLIWQVVLLYGLGMLERL